LLLEQAVHLVVFQRRGELVADLVESLHELELVGDAFLDDRTHVLGGIERGLLLQKTDLDAGLRPCLALEVRVDACHDLQQRRFARAVHAEHADLGAGEEAQADVAQDVPFRRNDLADAVHRKNVLGHWIAGSRGGLRLSMPRSASATTSAARRVAGGVEHDAGAGARGAAARGTASVGTARA
jgi:hypothetical protein